MIASQLNQLPILMQPQCLSGEENEEICFAYFVRVAVNSINFAMLKESAEHEIK